MRVRGLLCSVRITPTHVIITKGLRQTMIIRESITAIKFKYPAVIFYTNNKRWRVVLWHGGWRIKREIYGA